MWFHYAVDHTRLFFIVLLQAQFPMKQQSTLMTWFEDRPNTILEAALIIENGCIN